MKFQIHLFFTLVVLLASGCCAVLNIDCPESDSADETNSYIIELYGDHQANKDTIAMLEAAGLKVLDQCNCSPELVLIGADDLWNPDVVERVKGKVASVRPEEGGKSGLNLNISLPYRRSINKTTVTLPSIEALGSNAEASDLKIAIIDTGINFRKIGAGNSRLSGKAVSGGGCQKWEPKYLKTVSSHGSKAALAFNSAFQMYRRSNNYGVKYLDLRIFDKDEKGSLFKGLCAIRHSIDRRVDAIVMSWGFYVDMNNLKPGQEDAIALFKSILEEADNAGIPMIAAAGNGNPSDEVSLSEESMPGGVNIDEYPFYPASFSKDILHVIGVGAVGLDGEVASYSNTGGYNVGVFANESVNYQDETSYGTSFAAPKVAYVAAVWHKQEYGVERGTTRVSDEYLAGLKSIKDGTLPDFGMILHRHPSPGRYYPSGRN